MKWLPIRWLCQLQLTKHMFHSVKIGTLTLYCYLIWCSINTIYRNRKSMMKSWLIRWLYQLQLTKHTVIFTRFKVYLLLFITWFSTHSAQSTAHSAQSTVNKLVAKSIYTCFLESNGWYQNTNIRRPFHSILSTSIKSPVACVSNRRTNLCYYARTR